MVENNNYNNLIKLVKNIPGGISNNEALFLYNSAKQCPSESTIIEVGSWKGKSTVCLGLGSKAGNNAKVYAIDPHTGSPDHHRHGKPVWTLDIFRKNIKNAGIENLVESILKTGEEVAGVWNKPTCFVFIDAQYHDLELTKSLCFAWFSHLVEDGIMALHNTLPSIKGVLEGHPLKGCPPVISFMRSHIYSSNTFRVVKIAGTISVIKKCPRGSISTRLINLYRLLESYVVFIVYFFYKSLTNLPSPLRRTTKKIFGLSK